MGVCRIDPPLSEVRVDEKTMFGTDEKLNCCPAAVTGCLSGDLGGLYIGLLAADLSSCPFSLFIIKGSTSTIGPLPVCFPF